jgi:hypothetical protein
LRLTVSPRTGGYGLRYHEGMRFTKLGVGVAAGEPFTLAFWVRMEDDKPGPQLLFKTQGWVSDIQWYRNVLLKRDRKTGEIGFTIPGTGKTEKAQLTASRPGGKSSEWTHIALSRDKDGEFRMSVNGDVKEVADTFTGSIPINFFELAGGFEAGWRQDTPPYHVEVDELCLFGRDLSDDELAALAGRKALPKR